MLLRVLLLGTVNMWPLLKLASSLVRTQLAKQCFHTQNFSTFSDTFPSFTFPALISPPPPILLFSFPPMQEACISKAIG